MIRTRICLYLLILTPLVVYWQTIFHDYGMGDGYTFQREAREEPSKLVKFTASQGRPLYGALLETSFSVAEDVSLLPWLRLSSVLLLTLLGLALWRQLYQSGWTEVEAAAIGLGIVLLPAAQVTASWATAWPQVLTLLLAVAGFSAIETELERGGLKRAVALFGGGMIYLLAGLVYQSNALFAVVPIAAVLMVRTGREPMSDMRWILIHVTTLVIGLGLGYLLVKTLFNTGVFHESARMQLETNPLTKAGWFFANPLPNALALYALRDDFNTGALIFWGAVLATAILIGLGYRLDAKRAEAQLKRKWLLCLVVLPCLAHVVSLAAAERSTAYRTLFALSGLVLVLVVFGLRALQTAGRLKPKMHYIGLGLLCLGAAILAAHNSYSLLAEPQAKEWDMVRNVVSRSDFSKATKVYLITSAIGDRTTERVFGDEFGSLSSDRPEIATDMFKAALNERFPGKLPKGGSYTVAAGREAPADQAYDIVIDMRKLKHFRVP